MKFIEVKAKTVDEAITEATIQLGVTSDQIEYEILDEGKKGILGFNSKPAVLKVWKKNSVEETVRAFLDEIFKAMNMQVNMEFQVEEQQRTINVELRGSDMGVLIGKRGQTLDALQHLTNLAANKTQEERWKIKIDTENYRKRRKETLENLARNIAHKVRKTKRSVALEPMNPFERRVIHAVLQNDRYVATHSEGDEPNRYVVVTLKDHKKASGSDLRQGNLN